MLKSTICTSQHTADVQYLCGRGDQGVLLKKLLSSIPTVGVSCCHGYLMCFMTFDPCTAVIFIIAFCIVTLTI